MEGRFRNTHRSLPFGNSDLTIMIITFSKFGIVLLCGIGQLVILGESQTVSSCAMTMEIEVLPHIPFSP